MPYPSQTLQSIPQSCDFRKAESFTDLDLDQLMLVAELCKQIQVQLYSENKLTVLSSSDSLCVYRSFDAQPIFSSDEQGASKFKMERFLQPGQNSIATIYGPITYPPAPVLVLHKDPETAIHRIAATGTGPLL